ncbi:uncharacterized protein BX663DRAFT_268768 [Cokeromyces recurvatus]|uniref:uncharacterized protein n=1 Tax=Cokeromyces recurvatus TaxID=90255 RepID=UPI00221ED9E2|nr:uncharacterized protein BX663DRAFT_268768 [Cokeromyces recurvatus]KAI7898161.1 hypothetical protein BX663DRAFT_268768 [Cokeromyces recurvatus]
MGALYERYIVSLPLKLFVSASYEDVFDSIILEKIKKLSVFLWKVIFRAQLFVNYYILKYPDSLSNDFFQQNFWCSVCRLVNKNMTIDDFKQKYSSGIPCLGETWNELNDLEGVSMIVDKEGLSNYGQVLSTACEIVAICYNNFYVENFETIISNYLYTWSLLRFL